MFSRCFSLAVFSRVFGDSGSAHFHGGDFRNRQWPDEFGPLVFTDFQALSKVSLSLVKHKIQQLQFDQAV